MAHDTVKYSTEMLVNNMNKSEGKRGKIHVHFATQRLEGQWNREQQSLLIHSLLQDDVIPPLVVVRDGTVNINPMTVIEGCQRTSTTFLYVNNGFKLSKNVPDVTIKEALKDEFGNIIYDENGNQIKEEKTFSIAGLKYKQLPESLQDILMNFKWDVTYLFDCTEEDISRQMYKLNNGRQMTAAQRAITRLNVTLGVEIEKIAHNDFFNERIAYTAAQLKQSEGMRCVFQSLILLTNKHFNKLANADMSRLADQFNNDWSQGDLDELNDLFLILNNVLPQDNNLIKEKLTTSNIPILIMNVAKYCSLMEDGDITEQQYKDFLLYWLTEGIESELYTKYEGKSINDRTNVEKRIDIMETALLKFLKGEKLPMIEFEVSEEIQNIDNSLCTKLHEDNFDKNKFNLQTLMIASDYKFGDFDDSTLLDFQEHFLSQPNDIKENIISKMKLQNLNLYKYLSNISPKNPFMTSDNLLCVLSMLKNICDEKEIIPDKSWDKIVTKWINNFVYKCNDKDCVYNNITQDQVNYMMGKISYMYTDLEKYMVELNVRKMNS